MAKLLLLAVLNPRNLDWERFGFKQFQPNPGNT
uniref:Uncharacterized protein n=1 Tax=Arundo donax TaxID=35708 RepID=A0A0A8YVS1_ARUDO